MKYILFLCCFLLNIHAEDSFDNYSSEIIIKDNNIITVNDFAKITGDGKGFLKGFFKCLPTQRKHWFLKDEKISYKITSASLNNYPMSWKADSPVDYEDLVFFDEKILPETGEFNFKIDYSLEGLIEEKKNYHKLFFDMNSPYWKVGIKKALIRISLEKKHDPAKIKIAGIVVDEKKNHLRGLTVSKIFQGEKTVIQLENKEPLKAFQSLAIELWWPSH